MDKLSKNIRRPGGDLVSVKRPHGRRLLLPTEVELCKLLNLSEDEYWYFVDLGAAYNGERPKGYELIPDIQAAQVLAIKGVKAFLINVGIALAASYVTYLLTPKPKEPGSSRRTADAIGNSKFAPQSSFDSIQELANIGDAIPLIFANSDEKSGCGGIRVNSQLLWSQFVSLGKYQQLKALTLFSLGSIDGEPDFEGYAVGDTLLNTYNSHKVGLYFRDGSNVNDNRIIESDRYQESKLTFPSNDPFEVGIPDRQSRDSNPTITSKAFSGARNPTTQTKFGAYSPFPNAQVCRLPYELMTVSRDAEKETAHDIQRKRKKVEFAHWPTRSGFLSATNGGNVGSELWYQIVGTDAGEANGLQRVYDEDNKHDDSFSYRPHGVDDVDSMTIGIRENSDSMFAVGEQYLIGTAIAKCTHITKAEPWTIDKTKAYKFEITEAGDLDIPVNNNLSLHCNNPIWYDPPGSGNDLDPTYSLSDKAIILYQQEISNTLLNRPRGHRDIYYSWNIYTGQRIAMATVSNNRKCDVTEIGIKSRVYKRIRFANVDSQPDGDTLRRAYNDRSQITLGQIDRYITRLSFFMLQYREVGGSSWTDLKNTYGNNHTGLFAVKGNTSEFQYNYISISHPDNTKQYEYRFKPYPGNYITRGNNWNKYVNLLQTPSGEDTNKAHFESHNFNIAFSGDESYYLNPSTEVLSNPEWQIGPTKQTISGSVKSITNSNRSNWQSSSAFNGIPTRTYWKPEPEDIWTEHRAIVYQQNATNPWVPVGEYGWSLYWDGRHYEAKNGGYDPGPGVGNWRNVIFKIPGDPKRYRATQNSTGGHPENKYWYFYVKIESQVSENTPVHFRGTVSVLGGSGTAETLKVDLTVYKQEYTDSNGVAQYYYYAKWIPHPAFQGVGFKNGDIAHLPSSADIPAVGLPQRIQVQLEVGSREIKIAEKNLNLYDVVADWNVYEGDENSNRNEPEHEIVYVNEIVKPVGNNANAAAKYSGLAFAGLRINNSKEWTNFSQFSAYFKKGIKIKRLIDGGTGASNLFPEIAYALLTDKEIGAGSLVGTSSVDEGSMTSAARYCRANEFFWDGTISSKINLRDFIFEHAGYCLLDFTIIGGKFSLKPSLPINGRNEIDKTILPEIKALFTDGNINDLQVSFLSPEERQVFRAAVIYREESVNGFPELRSILVRSRQGATTDPIETFDLSGFCTSEKQAESFAYFAINTRLLVDHGLTFKTAPQYVQGLSPGDYFRLVSEVTHTSRFRNGAKLEDGTIVSKDDVSGSEDVLYWEPGTVGVKPSTLSQAPNGVLFTVKNTTTENKVYKCETISYAEDGLIELSGSYAPIETNGQLSVMQNWDAGGFEVTGN